jgi:hypothetical protein
VRMKLVAIAVLLVGAALKSPGQQVFDVRQFGATGKRADNATKAIRDAVEACFKAGGGMVYVPPGEYTTGVIELKDNVNLHIEAGGSLLLSQNRDDFNNRRAMIYSDGAKNIAVTGRGTLDGLAKYEWVPARGLDPEIVTEMEIARKAGIEMNRYYRTGMQTYMFILNNSVDVRLENITIVNSPLWNVRLNDCDRVFVRGVRIYSNLDKGVNADGIDIVSSSNVLISDSIIVTGDDSIAMKTIGRGGAPARPVENVTVTNCILSSSSSAVTIGTETHADVRHVVVTNSVIRNANRGLSINVMDGATVSDVLFSNITMDTSRRHWNWWGSAETFRFTLRKRRLDSKLGAISDIVINNVTSHARGTSAIVGHPERRIRNVTISDVRMHMEPENAVDKRATDAIRIENVSGLKIRDVTVKWATEGAEPKWASAALFRNVTDLELANFTGRQGLKFSTTPAVVLENVAGATIHGSRADTDCGIFLEVRGKASKSIALWDNDTNAAVKRIVFENDAVRNQVTTR